MSDTPERDGISINTINNKYDYASSPDHIRNPDHNAFLLYTNTFHQLKSQWDIFWHHLKYVSSIYLIIESFSFILPLLAPLYETQEPLYHDVFWLSYGGKAFWRCVFAPCQQHFLNPCNFQLKLVCSRREQKKYFVNLHEPGAQERTGQTRTNANEFLCTVQLTKTQINHLPHESLALNHPKYLYFCKLGSVRELNATYVQEETDCGGHKRRCMTQVSRIDIYLL